MHICDFFWAGRILQGLNQFGILGVAGNKRRLPKQSSWAKTDDIYTWDNFDNLCGIVAHGKGFPPDNLSFYGPSAQEVKSLDGLMLISYSETLHNNSLYFDERFDFHFYDMDFCRQAELKGVKMGTWPISVVHGSEGQAEPDDSWKAGYKRYLDKWES